MAKKMNHPHWGRVAFAIGWVTFLEIIRDKILYNIILCGFLLFGIGFLAARLTFVRPDRVILDFGLSAVALSCAVIGAFTGSSLLGREFERRTIYVALSHPISRAQFILGKFAGIVFVLMLNWFLLLGVYLCILLASGGGDNITKTLFMALFLVLIESTLIASIALFFSTFSTTSLSVIMTVGTYLIGNNVSQIRLIAARVHSSFGVVFLNVFSAAVPNLEHFDLGLKVTYGLPVTLHYFVVSMVYGFFIIAFMLIFSGLLIRGREV